MMESLPSLRYHDCWWIVGILSITYLLGVQWGLRLAHTEDVSKLQESLDAWNLKWEEYVEPAFETVYDFAEDSFELQKLAGAITHNKQRRSKPWQPEVPRFSPPEKLKLPKPIINVGFPKAGTSSIFSFFHCNGLKGQHWFCCEPQDNPAGTEHQFLMSRCILENLIDMHRNHRQNVSRPKKRIFEGCGDYDFYSEINGPRMFQRNNFRVLQDDGSLLTKTQTKKHPRLILPQHHYLEEIHEQFPNATFLLNLRPTQQWVDSVMRWGTTLRQEIPNEFVAQDLSRGFSTFGDRVKLKQHYGIVNLPPQSVSDLNGTLAFIMDYHSNYIREFVRRHPSHTLIEVDITHKDAGKLLANAFGLNETCWEHRNQNNKTGNDTNASMLLEPSNSKILLRKEAARTKRAEMDVAMKQSWGNTADDREQDSNDDQHNEKRQGITTHGDTFHDMDEDLHTHLNMMMTNAHDEFEMYNVGDVNAEARNARKELYQQRLKQAQAQAQQTSTR